ncbi:MAG: hypothetical protein G3M70_15840 [Candidatus Nitronauta litoralis]|uniref:DUF86 domain-containing protein n=1 Tax=Candidatus Nitronauta litoralis TaxID=2705533 RepID=A0A7T0BYF4_9BACT|nr:MAG: hypothetical protein G3M70_15840 [Candidatus Nitronauta litoralis]
MSDLQEDVPLPVLLGHLKWNLQRFREMLDQEATPYFRDAALQRFEFTMSSVLKCIAAASGQKENAGPENLLDHALKENWLPEGTDTGDILNSIESLKPESRAETSDTVYKKLAGYYESFEKLHLKLQ